MVVDYFGLHASRSGARAGCADIFIWRVTFPDR